MTLKLTRWLLPIFLPVFLILALVAPVLAISQPDGISINGIWVFRNCRETDDQLYLISYTINYTSIPDDNVSEAYLCRLMDGDDTLESVAPYAYYNKGYGDGVVAIYFDANDAPEWEGLYTMQLLGNPFIEWSGGVPSDSVTSINFDTWADNEMGTTRVVVSGRILDLAGELEISWGKDMVTESDAGEQVLTNYAAAYFINVIPYLSDIAPNIFAKGEGMTTDVISPEIPPDESGSEYADSLIAAITGTPFDLTPLANSFGVSRGALSAVLYYGVVVAGLILISRRMQSYRPLMLIAIPFVVLGAFIGVPLIVTILVGLVNLGFISYTIFYKPSSA